MYDSHFGLRSRPFRSGPDPSSYYPAETHERALGRLLQAIRDDEGLCLVTGRPGTGKTLICQCLLDRLGTEVTSAFLTNSHFSGRAGLLQAILFDLSSPYEGKTEQELRLAVTDLLLARYADGRRTILVVDEAQTLTPDLLEELRLLLNLETGAGRAIQIILSAQPEFLDTLRYSELKAFSQRLVVRLGLDPLDAREAADYLRHQVRAAGGGDKNLFTDEALEVIARNAKGLPRVLNQVAHQAMILAHGAGSFMVDFEAATEAQSILGLEAPEDDAGRFPAIVPAPDELPVDATPARKRGRRRTASPNKPARRPA